MCSTAILAKGRFAQQKIPGFPWGKSEDPMRFHLKAGLSTLAFHIARDRKHDRFPPNKLAKEAGNSLISEKSI